MGGYAPPPMSGRRAMTIADLISRRGDIAARRAMASGSAWGNAIAGLGQAVGGAIQQHQELKAEEKRKRLQSEAFQQVFSDPETFQNPMAMAQRLAPFMGVKDAITAAKGFSDLQGGMQTQEVDPEQADKLLRSGAQRYGGLSDEAREAMRPGMVNFAVQSGRLTQDMAQNMSPQAIDEIISSFAEQRDPRGEIRTVAGPDGQPMDKFFTYAELEKGVSTYQKPEKTIEEKAAEARALAQAREEGAAAGAPAPQANPAEATAAAAKGETALRKEYQAQVKPAVTGIQAIDRFSRKPAEKVARGERLSPEEQFAMIYAFNKALDPTSVVREGEFRNTRQVGAGITERAFLALERWRSGEQLTQEQAKGMMKVINNTRSTLQKQIDDQDAFFSDLSTQYGYKPENVIGGTAGYRKAEETSPQGREIKSSVKGVKITRLD